MGFEEEYLEKRTATFGELKKNILGQKAKSEYKQSAIIMIRHAFDELELCGGKTSHESAVLPFHGVMPSLLSDVKLKIDYHKNKMETAKSVNDFQNALYHQQRMGTFEDVLILIEGNGA
ncbi:MAG: hypothetical protein BV456_08935 [Thermoplasmata archaeon M8B2D]|nr:MAG: hypothetical protein BV456_08935 [Thermoplasmata archaeon M8B2D]